jgi:hypothetical protein
MAYGLAKIRHNRNKSAACMVGICMSDSYFWNGGTRIRNSEFRIRIPLLLFYEVMVIVDGMHIELIVLIVVNSTINSMGMHSICTCTCRFYTVLISLEFSIQFVYCVCVYIVGNGHGTQSSVLGSGNCNHNP